MRIRVLSFVASVLALIAAGSSVLCAQGRGGGGRGAQAPQTPQAGAPIDLTGYWVSIVNEDWRWRMVTPPKGDYASVPLSPEGTRVANTWDPSQDGSCLAYGVGGLMRMPTRLQITWADPQTLQIQTDAGQQTRTVHFTAGDPGPRSLQGYSAGTWERPGARGRGAAAVQPRGGSLKVTTSNITAGWLRRNGVPYSQDANITEYFDRFQSTNGSEWMVVTTVVSDPKYLNQRFITSSHFRREPNGSKWNPAPCRP